MAGISAGFACGTALWLAFGSAFWLVAGLASGLALGLAGGPVAGISGALADPSPQARGPREVILASGTYGLVAGLAFGLAFGLAGGMADRLAVGLAGGLAGGISGGFVLGFAIGFAIFAGAWTRYHITAITNAVRGRSPLRFGDFLDWAVQAGILRVSGVAYQFRHRQLQDWLASPGRGPDQESQ
jgi:hypothetical protein